MIFELNEELLFPPVELSNEDGLLAFGGDLSMPRLLHAYSHGIFPWYNPKDPILWWSPDPRFVLYPDKVKVSKSMRKIIEKEEFRITVDCSFRNVIEACSTAPRRGQQGTWITKEMVDAYCALHEAGYAHSVEAWQGEKLVGGLYGVSLGSVFFGESMFASVSNASKSAFLQFAKFLNKLDFSLIDSQVHTPHLESLGAEHIARFEYLAILEEGLQVETRRGSWTELYSSVTSSSSIF